jgi:hypothetical protein
MTHARASLASGSARPHVESWCRVDRRRGSIVLGIGILVALVGAVAFSVRSDASGDVPPTLSRAQLDASDELWLSDVNGDARPDAIALDAQRVSVYLAVADGYQTLIDDDGAPIAVDLSDGRSTVACLPDGTLFLQTSVSPGTTGMMHFLQLQIEGAVGTWDIEPGFMVGPDFRLTTLGNGCGAQPSSG